MWSSWRWASAAMAAASSGSVRDPRWQRQIWGCIGQCTAFYLHYVADAVAEQARYGALVHRMMAALVPPMPPPAPPVRSRRRIVFASAYLRDHTVARLFVPLFERLDPAAFDVHAVALAPASDAFARNLAPHITLHRGPLEAAQRHRQLQALAPDVLVYLDIGMHPLPQALAALRIAPVQAALWGHPVTTGLPTLDWFVSAEAMEPPDADAHYTERLLRLPGLGNALGAPPPSGVAPPAFAREAGRIELFCAQSVYKLTPDHDALFARVLARLPTARLHLIPHERAEIRDWLAARLANACAATGVDLTERLVLHPLLPLADYLALAGACDLALDTLHWSGGMSSLDLLGQGLPRNTSTPCRRVSKTVPPKRQIIKDISLSFFPGAKIGLLGLNGAGKSTVLKIMAGVDTDFTGEARPQPGIKVGYLEQEPRLNPSRPCARPSRKAWAKCCRRRPAGRGLRGLRRGRRRFRRAGQGAGAPGGDPRRRRRAHPGEPAGSRRRRAAPAALGCDHRQALRRREAPRGAVPPAAAEAGHAAARRTDQPPRRRIGGVAGAVPGALHRHRGGGDP
jgi:hypothetical protein